MAMNCPVQTNTTTRGTQFVHFESGIADFFSADHLDKLQSIMNTKKMDAGTYLFHEGDTTGKLYLVCSGRVKLRKSTEEGKDFVLSVLRNGDLLGEIGGYSNMTHSFSAEVIESGEIGIITWKDMEALLVRHADFALQFMNWMGLMHRITQSKFRDLLLFGKPGALASTLIRLSNTYGVLCKDGIRLDIKLTNTDMADMIGTSRESVNRMLSAMKDEGSIDIVNGKMIIRRLDDLRRMCNCPTCPACPKEICRI